MKKNNNSKEVDKILSKLNKNNKTPDVIASESTLKKMDKKALEEQETYHGAELVEAYLEDESNNLKVKDSDPDHLHIFSNTEKAFIETYLLSGSIDVAGVVLDLEAAEAYKLYYNPFVNKEIRRLQGELNTLRFTQKIMTLDEMQSYLTSWILDINVNDKNRLSNRDKLTALKLLAELKIIKSNNRPDAIEVINSMPTEDKLKELSVDAIKALIEQNDKENNDANNTNQSDNLSQISTNQKTSEEVIKELTKLADTVKEDKNGDNK